MIRKLVKLYPEDKMRGHALVNLLIINNVINSIEFFSELLKSNSF